MQYIPGAWSFVSGGGSCLLLLSCLHRTGAQVSASLSQQPFCCLHCQQGLVCGQIGFGMNPCTLLWGGTVRSLFSQRRATLNHMSWDRWRKPGESFLPALWTKGHHFHFAVFLDNYVAGPVCYTFILLVSPFLSGCFLLKHVDRIKITSYFPCSTPCPQPLMDLSAFMGFHWSDPLLKLKGSNDTFL